MLLKVAVVSFISLWLASVFNSYSKECNKCIHKNCPLTYIHKLCEDAQVNNTIYNNIYYEKESEMDEYDILKYYAITRGKEIKKCVKMVRKICNNYCDSCKTEIIISPYKINLQPQNISKYINIQYEDCILNNIDLKKINSECWISINRDKCLFKQYENLRQLCGSPV